MAKQIAAYWFEPDAQPFEDRKVGFYLRPLNQETYWKLQAAYIRGGKVPEWDGIAAAFEYAVSDWRGLEEPYTRDAKREALNVRSPRMALWQMQIAGELYREALLSEEEQKNS